MSLCQSSLGPARSKRRGGCSRGPDGSDASMSPADRANFNAALNEWAAYTNLQFNLIPDGAPSPYQTYIIVKKVPGREQDVVGRNHFEQAVDAGPFLRLELGVLG